MKSPFPWEDIQEYHNDGHTRLECISRFGFSPFAWSAAVRRGAIVPVDKFPLDEILRGLRPSYKRGNLKKRILKEGILEEVCNGCGIGPKWPPPLRWNSKPLSLQLDHINGVNNDHRLENLQFLCPNCHSQTPTFAGRNRKK